MTAWVDRTIEERALLNPAFCALLIWHFASSGEVHDKRALTFAETYLVLPIILPRNSREAMPRSTRTSLAVWMDENPTFQTTLAVRSRAMVSFTKEALLFGGRRQFLEISVDTVRARAEWKRVANSILRKSSPETQACFKKAAFLGDWFLETGAANTVMALLGVRP
jgi:hypothetical protein